jgi:hypothetical protein
LDGKHIGIKIPTGSGSLFYNLKKFSSVILSVSVGANYCFIAVDVVEVGKSSDSNVFKNQNRKETGFESTVNARQQSVNSSENCMPFVIVGADAFALSEQVLRPYPNRNSITNIQLKINKSSTNGRMCTFLWQMIGGFFTDH